MDSSATRIGKSIFMAYFKYIYLFILLAGVALFVFGLMADSSGMIAGLFAPGLVITGIVIVTAIQAIFFGFSRGSDGAVSPNKMPHAKLLKVLAIGVLVILGLVWFLG